MTNYARFNGMKMINVLRHIGTCMVDENVKLGLKCTPRLGKYNLRFRIIKALEDVNG
jgi:hypothetical protein